MALDLSLYSDQHCTQDHSHSPSSASEASPTLMSASMWHATSTQASVSAPTPSPPLQRAYTEGYFNYPAPAHNHAAFYSPPTPEPSHSHLHPPPFYPGYSNYYSHIQHAPLYSPPPPPQQQIPPMHTRQLSTESIHSVKSEPGRSEGEGELASLRSTSASSASPEMQHQHLESQYQQYQPLPQLLEQSLRADGKPKRPMNAFLIYGKQRRPQISRLHPDLKTGEISGILSREWGAMSNDAKQKWREQAQQLRETFNSRFPDYVYERSANGTRKHGSRGGKMTPARQIKGASAAAAAAPLLVEPAPGSAWQAPPLGPGSGFHLAPVHAQHRHAAAEHAYHPYAYQRAVHYEPVYPLPLREHELAPAATVDYGQQQQQQQPWSPRSHSLYDPQGSR